MSIVEQYEKPLQVAFKMPAVQLVSMKSNTEKLDAIGSRLTRSIVSWILSTRRRKFVLQNDFEIIVGGFSMPELNGTLVIPAHRQHERIEFDGASIPMPWLVAALSFDVLRPLGALLIPSIVHDYLFYFGEVQVKGSAEPVKIDRETADELFLRLFQSVSGMRWWPWVAWVAVRAGAPIIPYHGDKGGWNKQTVMVSITVLLLFAFLYLNIPALFWLLMVLLPGLTLMNRLVNWIVSPYRTEQQDVEKLSRQD